MIKYSFTIILVLIATASFGKAGWILLKAELAQYLIQSSWEETLATGANQKPWRWSDTWPVGKLVHAKSETQLYVLEGAQGNALAFGPGHHTDSPPLGQGGSVIGGHRDTHFTFLKKVRARDIMQLQLPNSQWVTYRVVSKTIVDAALAMKVDVNGQQLYLVTCYPFDAVSTQSNLRLVVELVETESQRT